MMRKTPIIFGALAASAMALSALALDAPDPKTDTLDRVSQRPVRVRANRLNGAAKASDIIGMTVKNYQDETLGKVEEIAVDVESGRILQVIVSTGKFIKVEDALTAVPPGALHHDVTNKALHLDANLEKLTAAPRFEMAKWAECCDSDHLSVVYRHFGEEPAFGFVQKGDAALDSQRKPDPAPSADLAAKADVKSLKESLLLSESQSIIPMARLLHVQKASKLMGKPVKNLKDETLGNLDNILLDLPSGRIVAMIVSSGGFLGMGEELSAVPPTALRFAADRESLLLDASKEVLGAAPHFKASEWPDFAQPVYASGVYRAYRVEPYFTVEPDNTGRNVRDQDGKTLTPLDQGNSKADVETTAGIRKGIMDVEGMSMNGKNVKIITIDGRVTLRGPVKTSDEKRIIGDLAAKAAGAKNVDNQLEVE